MNYLILYFSIGIIFSVICRIDYAKKMSIGHLTGITIFWPFIIFCIVIETRI